MSYTIVKENYQGRRDRQECHDMYLSPPGGGGCLHTCSTYGTWQGYQMGCSENASTNTLYVCLSQKMQGECWKRAAVKLAPRCGEQHFQPHKTRTEEVLRSTWIGSWDLEWGALRNLAFWDIKLCFKTRGIGVYVTCLPPIDLA